jgi:uncharacterized protein
MQSVKSSNIETKEKQLKEILLSLESVIVAYSGGVDSSLLAYYARLVLKNKAIIVIAKSESLANDELIHARKQAEQFGFDLVEIETNEMDNKDYRVNDGTRCYHCKKTLFKELAQMAVERQINFIAYGENIGDENDFRPGAIAASEYKVISPLKEVQLDKEEIRYLAKTAGLSAWDRPQAACLASRFPAFEAITITGLSQIEQAESFLKSCGFKQVRVRHHDALARIELGQDELLQLSSNKDLMSVVSHKLKEIGYRYVSLDLEGYRQGSSNAME